MKVYDRVSLAYKRYFMFIFIWRDLVNETENYNFEKLTTDFKIPLIQPPYGNTKF